METFTTVAMCPKCGSLDIHPFRMPRTPPPGYEPGVIKRVQANGVIHRIETWGLRDEYAMERGAEVIRQCQCGHEWPNG